MCCSSTQVLTFQARQREQVPTDLFIVRRDWQGHISMPTAPQCLSINTSSMQTTKEHFHPWNSTVAGDCPKKGCPGLAHSTAQPWAQFVFLAGEGRQRGARSSLQFNLQSIHTVQCCLNQMPALQEEWDPHGICTGTLEQSRGLPPWARTYL